MTKRSTLMAPLWISAQLLSRRLDGESQLVMSIMRDRNGNSFKNLTLQRSMYCIYPLSVVESKMGKDCKRGSVKEDVSTENNFQQYNKMADSLYSR